MLVLDLAGCYPPFLISPKLTVSKCRGEHSTPVPTTSHLAAVNTGWNFPFDSTVVRRIHPEKEFPASREGNGQGMEEIFGMDAAKKPNRN